LRFPGPSIVALPRPVDRRAGVSIVAQQGTEVQMLLGR
jgi:hypothetical protein